jgi:hypothetical protein
LLCVAVGEEEKTFYNYRRHFDVHLAAVEFGAVFRRDRLFSLVCLFELKSNSALLELVSPISNCENTN